MSAADPQEPAFSGRVWENLRAAAALFRGPALGWTLCYGALSLLAGVPAPAGAWLLSRLIDAAGTRAPLRTQLWLAAGIATTAVVAALLGPATLYAQGELGRRVGLRARGELMAAVNRLTGLDQIEQPVFADRLRLATQSGATAPQALARTGFAALAAATTTAGFVAAMGTVAPWLTAAVVAASIPAAVAAAAESRARARLLWRASPGFRREMFYAELLTGRHAKEVRLFGIGDLFRRRMLAEGERIAAGERALERRTAWTQAALATAAALMTGVAIGWAVVEVRAGALGVGALSVVITATTGLQASAASLVRNAGDTYATLLVFGHYREVLAAAPRHPCRRPALPAAPPLRRGIEFRDVHFAYPGGLPVLTGVSFTVPAGACVALVGANGAGKSTLVKLLCRFYEPTAGAILWDGADIATLDPSSLRRRFSALFQDFAEYDLSARDNIGLGDATRLDDEAAVVAAARRAQADGFLSRLPHGYDTLLTRAFPGDDPNGADGVQLSGGQWQRVALARAMMRPDADVLILDEPSAGLDPDAEAALHARLATLRAGRTSLLISHRLSAVRAADIIVVLDQGQVLEQGSHDQLLAHAGEYARLVGVQAAGYRP